MAIFEKNKQRYFASLRLCALHKNYNSYFNSATPNIEVMGKYILMMKLSGLTIAER
jgi:hypothetical protein